jgi:hypothetical protein
MSGGIGYQQETSGLTLSSEGRCTMDLTMLTVLIVGMLLGGLVMFLVTDARRTSSLRSNRSDKPSLTTVVSDKPKRIKDQQTLLAALVASDPAISTKQLAAQTGLSMRSVQRWKRKKITP